MRKSSESTNNFPFDATNSYKTQWFLVTASVFPHARGFNVDFNKQRMDKLQKNGGLEGFALSPAEPGDAAFVFFVWCQRLNALCSKRVEFNQQKTVITDAFFTVQSGCSSQLTVLQGVGLKSARKDSVWVKSSSMKVRSHGGKSFLKENDKRPHIKQQGQ